MALLQPAGTYRVSFLSISFSDMSRVPLLDLPTTSVLSSVSLLEPPLLPSSPSSSFSSFVGGTEGQVAPTTAKPPGGLLSGTKSTITSSKPRVVVPAVTSFKVLSPPRRVLAGSSQRGPALRTRAPMSTRRAEVLEDILQAVTKTPVKPPPDARQTTLTSFYRPMPPLLHNKRLQMIPLLDRVNMHPLQGHLRTIVVCTPLTI